MSAISLEAEGLSKRFGTVSALEDASFRFEGRGVIGYLGPNGAGKTTTLKLFSNLLRPSSGSARVNGLEVRAAPKEALWEVGSLIESPEPYPSQTGGEALAMVAEYRGLSSERAHDQIRRYAELLELPPLDRRSSRLSKGQRQRIVLAAALLSEPKVLLLDEPTSGLDPAERVIVRKLLVALRSDRLVLMSSHLLAEVTETCDRVLFVDKGRILLDDTISGLSERFKVTQADVEFLEPVAPDRWAALGSLVREVVPVGARRYRMSFDGEDRTRAELLRACLGIGAVISFAGSTLSLEDAYLQLVGAARGRDAALPPPPPPPVPS
jgi:ABC-2 type transport system ATP-binding protein